MVIWWLPWISDVVSVGQQSAATLHLSAHVPAGTVNHGPGIYNTSLHSHHKTLMFINVNGRDLFFNVVYVS